MHRYPVYLVFLISLAPIQLFPQQAEPTGQESAPVSQGDETINSDRETVELVEDSNVAEAVNRRPDLSFRNVTIDGEVAQVSLSNIQADQVESAEVSKAVTPDLDADLRGGGLNLRSKPTYDLPERVIKGEIGGDYNELIDEFEKEASITYGKSMGNWGFMGTVSTDHGIDGGEHYRQDWKRLNSENDDVYVIEDQTIDASFMDGAEYSANGTVDFKLSDPVRLFVKASHRRRDVTGYRPRLTVRHQRGDYSDVSDEGATVTGARAERTFTGWEHEGRSYSLSTGGYLDYDSISFDYQFSYNDSNMLEPDWFTGRFFQKDIDLRYDLSRQLGPEITLLHDSGDLNDPALFKNAWISRTRWELNDTNWTGTANAKIPFRLMGFDGHLKTGLKVKGLDFSENFDTRFLDQYDGPFTIADVLGSYSNTGILGGLYDHGPFPETSATRQFVDNNRSGFSENVTRSREESDPPTFDTREDIYAGYGMFFLSRNGFRLIAGMRYEQTELDYNANQLELDESGQYVSTTPLSGSSSYGNWFPGIHGRYDMGKFSFVGSWSNTIRRPDFDDVVPFRNINREALLIRAGNPQLKPTLYTNYDFAIDYKLNGGKDVASVELFYYTVEDIGYYGVTTIPDGIYAGYEFGTHLNGPSGDVYGFRLIWSRSLGDWLPFAKGLSLNAQYRYQTSETEYPDRPGVTLPMPIRPEHDFELNLTYRKAGFYAQLEVDYRGSNLRRINEDIRLDQYNAGRTRVDFTSSYQLTDGIRLVFEVRNLASNFSQDRRRGGRTFFGDGVWLAEYGYDLRTYSFALKFDI